MKIKRIFTYFSLLLLVGLSGSLVSCEDDSSTENPIVSNHIGLVPMNQAVYIAEDQTVTVEGKIYAAASTGSDRVINLEVVYESNYMEESNLTNATSARVKTTDMNPSYFSVPSTVTIPAGSKEGSFTVSITGTDLGSGKYIVIQIPESEDYDLDVTPYGTFGTEAYEIVSNRINIPVKLICYLNPLQIDIVTDRYAEEASWELYDADDITTPIASGGPYTQQSSAGLYPIQSLNLCLGDGSYVFVAYDSYGDGWISGGYNGSYTLSLTDPTGENIIEEIASNGNFSDFDVVYFDLP